MQPIVHIWQLVKRRLAGHDIAGSQAAEASTAASERRHEQEDADAHLVDAPHGLGTRQRDGRELGPVL